MKFEIVHRTIYLYASPVRDSFNEARLQPFSNALQTVDYFLLKVLPAARLQHHHDFYSNTIHHFEIAEPHSTLLVESHSRVTTRAAGVAGQETTRRGRWRASARRRANRGFSIFCRRAIMWKCRRRCGGWRWTRRRV